MKLREEAEILNRIEELKHDKDKFKEFLQDVYGDNQCAKKLEQHLWRINREIEILNWVIDNELPF